MPFKKKDKNINREGRKAGAINKTTKEAHELFMMIMNRQVDLIEESLQKIQNDDPEKYINALSKLMQYYIPRKTDITSDNEKIVPVIPVIIIE